MGSCKILLKIPLTDINEKVEELKLKNEISGIIQVSGNQVTEISKNVGSNDSVYTPNHVINYHTHPVSAYMNAKTVWGWPSGEDIREVIKFCLGGNKAHLVFTLEGLYTIQLSPCKTKKLKELTDVQRGVLIFIIEEYFKCTHNFRCISEVNKLASEGILINPYSYIDYVKNFELSNINSNDNIEYRSTPQENTNGHIFNKFPNKGFIEYSDKGIIKTLSLKNFLDDFLDLSDFENINDMGERIKGKLSVMEFEKELNELFEIFDAKECKQPWNNKPNLWFHVNFFPSNYFLGGDYLSGNKFIAPTKQISNDLLHIEEEPYIHIFSDSGEGCSIEQINKRYNFGKSGNSKFGNTFFRTSTFGKTRLNNLHYFLIQWVIKNKHPNNLKELVSTINKLIKQKHLCVHLVNSKILLSLNG